MSSQSSWLITIENSNAVLNIVDSKPSQEYINANQGDNLSFAVKAVLSGKKATANRLTYEWRLNNQQAQRTSSGEFNFKGEVIGTHYLTVTVFDDTGIKSEPRRWAVNIKPIKPEVVNLEPKQTEVKVSTIKDEDVKSWLDQYRNAWKAKNIPKLIELGEVDSRNAEKLKEILESYDDFNISLQNIDINIDGNHAVVSFDRVDSINGKDMAQPGKKRINLEKRADNKVVRN